MSSAGLEKVPSDHPILVVVVAYGSEEELAECLDALGNATRVVVIDNGHTEEARQVCLAGGADYVRTDSNIGFAAAVNVALRTRRTAGSDVLLLNPDARLGSEDLSLLRAGLHRSGDLAAVGPRLVNPDGSEQKVLWPIPSPWTALASVVGAADAVSRRQFISGAVLLLRGDALDQVGLFDEQFFLYAEETDWQLRAIQAGWRVAVVQDAVAVHVGGGTSADPARRQLLFDASAERFTRKWYGNFGWQVLRMASILAALRRLVSTRDEDTRLTQRRAMMNFFRGPVASLDASKVGE